MKPTDLKEIAERFTEKYYPQWLSRVDRIWKMLEKIDPKSLNFQFKNSQSIQGNAFGIAGETDPQFKEYMTGVAILAFTYQGVKDKNNISEDEIRKKVTIVPGSLNMPLGLQGKLENVLSEMLPLMIDSEVLKTKGKEVRDEKKYAKVWRNETGTEEEIINKQKFDEFEKMKLNYDIFIIDNGEYERDSVGSIYFNGNEIKDFTSLKYRILFYTLRKNGFPREAINIIENCWIGIDGRISELKKCWIEKNDPDMNQKFHEGINFMKTEISKLNRVIKNSFGIRLITKGTGLYRLDPETPKFCVMKIDSCT